MGYVGGRQPGCSLVDSEQRPFEDNSGPVQLLCIIKQNVYQGKKDDITTLNKYAPNQGAPKYIKQLLKELMGETGKTPSYYGT